mgnify:CR=1 FL=1
MLNEKMVSLGSRRSVIREIFEYGKKRKAEIGEENVFDFSLGNPNVPAPEEVKNAIIELLNEEDPIALHGYTNSNAGYADVREAVAQSVLTMQPETLRMILDGTVPKGDVFACARIAGIMAAKRTAELIPMCHPIPIESVDIAIEAVSETQVRVVSTLRCSHKTGIEMEALTAATVAALTVYDMCKAVDRGMRIDETLLLHKTGGKSGDYHAEGATAR